MKRRRFLGTLAGALAALGARRILSAAAAPVVELKTATPAVAPIAGIPTDGWRLVQTTEILDASRGLVKRIEHVFERPAEDGGTLELKTLSLLPLDGRSVWSLEADWPLFSFEKRRR